MNITGTTAILMDASTTPYGSYYLPDGKYGSIGITSGSSVSSNGLGFDASRTWTEKYKIN